MHGRFLWCCEMTYSVRPCQCVGMMPGWSYLRPECCDGLTCVIHRPLSFTASDWQQILSASFAYSRQPSRNSTPPHPHPWITFTIFWRLAVTDGKILWCRIIVLFSIRSSVQCSAGSIIAHERRKRDILRHQTRLKETLEFNWTKFHSFPPSFTHASLIYSFSSCHRPNLSINH
jgi:hypothetical protein